MEKIINFSAAEILKLGRTELKEDRLLLGWPGSGFCFSFFGTELRIKFGDFNSERHFYFQITIDKLKQTHCVSASDQIVIIRGLTPSLHHVKLIKITECMQKVEIKELVACGDNVYFESYSPFSNLKFEFVGDSLTAGFGNMSEPDAGIYRASEQDLTYGYSFLTASKFNADSRYICCSGKGIFNNWDGSKENRITDFYDKTYIGEEEIYDFKSWRPDVIFLNAGTNDITAKTDPKDFKPAYISFINKLWELNPSSSIICIHGLTTNTFEETFDEIEAEFKGQQNKNSKKIEFIKFNPIPAELYGALGHPNSKAHAHFAREVIKVVKKTIRK